MTEKLKRYVMKKTQEEKDEAMRALAREHLRQILGENWEEEPDVIEAARLDALEEAAEEARLKDTD